VRVSDAEFGGAEIAAPLVGRIDKKADRRRRRDQFVQQLKTLCGQRIVRAGLAVARPEIVKAGGRTLSMLRLTITDAGRRALAGT
jgi:hypothetical protein